MSAWAELVAKTSDEDQELLSRALTEVQTEYARRLAKRQRARAELCSIAQSEQMQAVAEGLRLGADLIDPEPTDG